MSLGRPQANQPTSGHSSSVVVLQLPLNIPPEAAVSTHCARLGGLAFAWPSHHGPSETRLASWPRPFPYPQRSPSPAGCLGRKQPHVSVRHGMDSQVHRVRDRSTAFLWHHTVEPSEPRLVPYHTHSLPGTNKRPSEHHLRRVSADDSPDGVGSGSLTRRHHPAGRRLTFSPGIYLGAHPEFGSR